MGGIAARLDDLGKPAWIALVILGFFIHWPVGLAVLAFLIWSGRMGCWKHEYAGRWQSNGNGHGPDWASHWFGHRRTGSRGNRAFDEARPETPRRRRAGQKGVTAIPTRLAV